MDSIIKKHHSNDAGFCRHYMTLYAITLGMEAQNVFEFGAGFSSYTILAALKKTGGRLTSCDITPQEKRENWNFINDNSLNIFPLKETFDLVLHDGSHEKHIVEQDLRNIIPLMKQDALLLVHDTEHKSFRLGEAVDNALKNIDHEKVTLPYGYGLTIIRIKENFGNGKVEIKWTKNI